MLSCVGMRAHHAWQSSKRNGGGDIKTKVEGGRIRRHQRRAVLIGPGATAGDNDGDGQSWVRFLEMVVTPAYTFAGAGAIVNC